MLVLIIPPLHWRWNGGILDSPRCWSVCLSVRPPTCRQDFRNFLKKLLAQFISYLAFTLMGWISWPLYILVILASFWALRWPNIWPKIGFPELFKKTIGSIHFIPGIYLYRMSFLTPIHLCVPSRIFLPLVAIYLAENWVSRTFWKNYWLNLCFHYWLNLYWILLDEVGSDQIGGILILYLWTQLVILWGYNFAPITTISSVIIHAYIRPGYDQYCPLCSNMNVRSFTL